MSTAQIIKYTAGTYRTNIYLVYDSDTKNCVIIDPGYNVESLYSDIERLGLCPVYIILTHGHSDHTGGIKKLKDTFPAIRLVASSAEKKFLYDRDLNLGNGGIIADINVKDGDSLNLDTLHFDFIASPGHTPGSVCIKYGNILFSGDTLFFQGVGRTDLPCGNEKDLFISIENLFSILPDDTKVFPGHGPETSIAYERRNNPFV